MLSSATLTSTGGAVNTGTVTFLVMNGATLIGKATTSGIVKNGVASVNYTLPAKLAPGNYTIVANYDSSPNVIAASDNSHTLAVRYATSMTVSSSSSRSPVNAAVTITAKITSPTGKVGLLIGETVTFKIGATVIGTAVINGSGVASFTTSALTAGTHTIVAVFADDGLFAACTASHIIQIVSVGSRLV